MGVGEEWEVYARHTPAGWEAGFRKGGMFVLKASAASAEALLRLVLPDLLEVIEGLGCGEELRVL